MSKENKLNNFKTNALYCAHCGMGRHRSTNPFTPRGLSRHLNKDCRTLYPGNAPQRRLEYKKKKAEQAKKAKQAKLLKRKGKEEKTKKRKKRRKEKERKKEKKQTEPKKNSQGGREDKRTRSTSCPPLISGRLLHSVTIEEDSTDECELTSDCENENGAKRVAANAESSENVRKVAKESSENGKVAKESSENVRNVSEISCNGRGQNDRSVLFHLFQPPPL